MSAENPIGGMEYGVSAGLNLGGIIMTEYQEDQYLDCKGLSCPLPILKTKKIMDTMNTGELLKMVSTDPGAINDMQAFTRRTGHELLESISEGGDYIFFVRKT
jgi:tRNA 2-thiouridine synthesizing protein A